ncbi:hypothetical protein CVS40_5981 [Lucilia cuprina]|nr:hypothetical protein CVS40_5981 [Lucilia cuprina]
MGNRTNASASCEDLVIDILLTDDDTPSDKMQLTITENEVDLGTSIYHLKLPLMHPINVDRCHAKYHADQCKLTLTLRLRRELDFVYQCKVQPEVDRKSGSGGFGHNKQNFTKVLIDFNSKKYMAYQQQVNGS